MDTMAFEVTVRKKIPYLTNIISALLLLCIITVVLAYIVFIPAKKSPGELQVLYIVEFVPGFITATLVFAVTGIIILLPFFWIRLYKPATLNFAPNSITITGENFHWDQPLETIKNIYCHDPQTQRGFPKQKLTLFFQLYNEKTTSVRLNDYLQSERFMEQLLTYNKRISYYDSIFPFPNEQ